jgi:phosphoribosyl 1,2-cyclic phosphate phosphodiesterase
MFHATDSFYPTFLEAHAIEDGTFTIDGIMIRMFAQEHGHQRSSGFRIGNMAYSTDVKSFPKESEECLKDLDLWIVDALRDAEHKTHAHVALTLEWIQKYAPKRAILTHLSELLDYDDLAARIPAHVSVAYDGIEMEF